MANKDKNSTNKKIHLMFCLRGYILYLNVYDLPENGVTPVVGIEDEVTSKVDVDLPEKATVIKQC